MVRGTFLTSSLTAACGAMLTSTDGHHTTAGTHALRAWPDIPRAARHGGRASGTGAAPGGQRTLLRARLRQHLPHLGVQRRRHVSRCQVTAGLPPSPLTSLRRTATRSADRFVPPPIRSPYGQCRSTLCAHTLPPPDVRAAVTPQPPAGTRYVHGPGSATDVSVTNMAATFTATVAGTYQVGSSPCR
jgi:hypothetical protein